ncbi:MAG: hypothetical protein KC496_00235 [Anaerolineae bacterium]|nr:hypothetical protein [Anaerolineae bacterium]
MNMLATLTTENDIADERDVIGGNGPLNSGAYKFTIQYAYIGKANSGALSLNISAKNEDGRDLRQTLWMTSGTEKGCKNYYEKDGQKNYLPGFLHANAIALLTCGKEISQLDTEKKVINLYSYEAKVEVPTPVDMVMDLVGKEVIFGVIKQVVDKTAKNEATGAYEPTGETREENEIDKVFRASDRKTTAEIRAKAEEATFIGSWTEKWEGKVRERAKGKGSAGMTGMPKVGGGAKASPAAGRPTTSLFG